MRVTDRTQVGGESAGNARAARYRDVFAVGEFRALFAAHLLSLFGDQLAKIAVAVLVFSHTDSALLSAAAFGIGYLPWAVGGPLLSALSDRYPRRTVMVTCDLARAALVGALAVPGIPVPVLIAVLFVAALFTPPFQAARSATLPEVLDGDTYVVGQGLSTLSMQLAQVLGFAAGGVLVAVVTARGAILVDAVTFAVSALLVRAFVADRRPPAAARSSSWHSDVRDGFRLVFGDQVLRTYLLLAWVGAAAVTAPEGLMVTYAAHRHGGPATVGVLLAAMPLGMVVGAVLYGRFTPPWRRRRLIRPMAFGATLALLPVWMDPPLATVLALLVLAGFGSAYVIVLNAMFVQTVPATHRGRAHGVAAAGLMIGQGGGTALAGAVADVLGDPAAVIGLCGLAGALAVVPIALTWPRTGHTPFPQHRERPGKEEAMRGIDWD
ncbi:MAG: MFS transporter [Streptosporangiales bacterium]|nr:MFS transporter [Streptosporangiales bacterium]